MAKRLKLFSAYLHMSHYLCFYSWTDIGEVGRSTRAFSELAGRTESMVSDVVLALVEMGKFSGMHFIVVYSYS